MSEKSFFLYLTVTLLSRVKSSSLIIKKQPPLRYVREGDVNLGAILPGLSFDRKQLCGISSFTNSSFHFSESVVYAVDRVNRNSSILPNVRLGLVILDDCMKESTAAIQALSFVRTAQRDRASDHQDVLESYDVVGVIGSLRSSSSMYAATILGPAEVPLVSFTSTSEVLGDQDAFPYFLRVVPADNYLVDALVKLITHFGWTYISVVYSEGQFGEIAFQSLKTKLTTLDGACIATSHKIYQSYTFEDYEAVLKELLQQRNARVIVAFTDIDGNLSLLKASVKLGAGGYFIWLGNEAWKISITSMHDTELIKSLAGSFALGFETRISEDYEAHVRAMTPSNSENPWFRKFWSETFQCSLTDPSCASGHNASQLPGSQGHAYTLNAYDAVLTYAHAIERLVKRKCPEKSGRDVRGCIGGPELLAEMKSLSFYGPTGLVEFDKNGSLLARILVEQFIPNGNLTRMDVLPVAMYDARTSQMTYTRDIVFDHLSRDGAFHRGVPQSVCSQPCRPGEYLIQKDKKCCWDCRRCRSNEIAIKDNTDCLPCPQFTWPDRATNFTSCQDIAPDHPDPSEPLVILCLTLSIIGLTSVVCVSGVYVRYRSARIIKATSTELSYLQLFAVFTGFLTVPVLNVKPTDVLCVTSFFMYCLSFTWLYAPLLVKAVRIFRIFEGSKKSTSRVKFISPRSQVIFTSFLISVQVLLCVIVTLFSKPSISLTQEVLSENYVELSCIWTVPGMTSFLGYNLVLVLLCTVFAFKTRKLPDNFNESRFISISVYTTLIVWLAFIPTYYTAGRQYMKTLLLSLSLLVNHTVAIVFLYLPKIYAAISLTPETSKTANGSFVAAHPSRENGAPAKWLPQTSPGERAKDSGATHAQELGASSYSLTNYDIFQVTDIDKISSA